MIQITALGQTVTFDENRILFAEARALEQVTGVSGLPELFKRLGEGSATATQAIVWMALRRTNPGLTFTDLDNEDMLTSINEVAPEVEEGQNPDPLPGTGDTSPLAPTP